MNERNFTTSLRKANLGQVVCTNRRHEERGLRHSRVMRLGPLRAGTALGQSLGRLCPHKLVARQGLILSVPSFSLLHA